MSRNKKTLILCCLLFVIIVFATIFLIGNHSTLQENDTSTAPGVAWLKELESKDPATVDTTLKAQRRQELLANRDEYLKKLENNEINVWSCFEDYLLLGDSRAVGFEYYEYLDDNRVWAEGGATIRHLADNIPAIVEENPSYLFLCYGLNDVSIGYWNSPEEYISEFSETIQQLHTLLPEMTIIISSILIARDPAFEQASAWYNIPEYSSAVEVMCGEVDCFFVNNDEITELYAQLWDSDGIHLNEEFYPYWATNMIMAIYDSEVALAETE